MSDQPGVATILQGLPLPETNGAQPSRLAPASDERPWPVLDPAAYHGLAGEIVQALDPFTEADPVAVLLSLLTGFGNAVGPSPAATADSARHPARLFVVIVGESGKSRKGTSWRHASRVLTIADDRWGTRQVKSGLSSGEGLIAAVADPSEDGAEEDGRRPQSVDKRLLVVEEEFSRVLSVARREGSTLTAIVRNAWDTGTLQVLTKAQQVATGAHISIIGHITVEELRSKLTETDMANGLANRFLFVCARRSKRLPFAPSPPATLVPELGARVGKALDDSRRHGTVGRDAETDRLWAELYEEMGDDEPGGLLGALVGRPEAQTLRLAVTYALLDGTPTIRVEHLRAAWAVWRYCRDSVEHIFGDTIGDEHADRLFAAIRRAGPDGLEGQAQSHVFSRHVPARQLAAIRQRLEQMGRIVTVQEDSGGGRPRTVSYETRHAPR